MRSSKSSRARSLLIKTSSTNSTGSPTYLRVSSSRPNTPQSATSRKTYSIAKSGLIGSSRRLTITIAIGTNVGNASRNPSPMNASSSLKIWGSITRPTPKRSKKSNSAAKIGSSKHLSQEKQWTRSNILIISTSLDKSMRKRSRSSSKITLTTRTRQRHNSIRKLKTSNRTFYPSIRIWVKSTKNWRRKTNSTRTKRPKWSNLRLN